MTTTSSWLRGRYLRARVGAGGAEEAPRGPHMHMGPAAGTDRQPRSPPCPPAAVTQPLVGGRPRRPLRVARALCSVSRFPSSSESRAPAQRAPVRIDSATLAPPSRSRVPAVSRPLQRLRGPLGASEFCPAGDGRRRRRAALTTGGGSAGVAAT